MKTDIILSGVGGQGILSIAAVIGTAVVKKNWYLKQAEVHGMSQRGGDVQSHLRISDKPIFSDLITAGRADIILAVEPMEALRYLPFLKSDGILITSSVPFNNIPDYPPVDELLRTINELPHKIMFNADEVAKEVGNIRTSNIVMLGAAVPYLGLSVTEIEDGIRDMFARKGENVVAMNIKALNAGLKIAKES